MVVRKLEVTKQDPKINRGLNLESAIRLQLYCIHEIKVAIVITSNMFSNQYYSNWGNIFVPYKYKSLIISVGYIWGSEVIRLYKNRIIDMQQGTT